MRPRCDGAAVICRVAAKGVGVRGGEGRRRRREGGMDGWMGERGYCSQQSHTSVTPAAAFDRRGGCRRYLRGRHLSHHCPVEIIRPIKTPFFRFRVHTCIQYYYCTHAYNIRVYTNVPRVLQGACSEIRFLPVRFINFYAIYHTSRDDDDYNNDNDDDAKSPLLNESN